MKLLYITNGINGSGGLERVLSVKASMLAEDYEHDVSILVLNNTDKNLFYNYSPKIRFHSIDVKGNPLQYISSYKKGIQKIVHELEPDIISVCDDGLKAFFIPIFLKADSKIVYERHVSKLAETNANQSFSQKVIIKLKWSLMSILAKKFEKFIVLTEGNKNEWKSLNNIKVIANPLSFYPEISSNLENKKIICVGKICFQKGQDLLLQAWDTIYSNHPDWILELYGKEDNNFLDTTNLSKKNIFWYPPAKNIEEKYLESSIYVMSSRFEGFGMVLIEAMACGLPCISFDCNYGPSDIIDNGRDGFLVKKESIEDFSSKILMLIEDENLRKTMGQNSKISALSYDSKHIIAKWEDLFQKIR